MYYGVYSIKAYLVPFHPYIHKSCIKMSVFMYVHVLTVDFSFSERLAERVMAVLFLWHTQHRSLMGFITIMYGRSCRHSWVNVEYAAALIKLVAAAGR